MENEIDKLSQEASCLPCLSNPPAWLIDDGRLDNDLISEIVAAAMDIEINNK